MAGGDVEFVMPSLGADMEAGTLVEWLVKPGDHVRRGDVVAVVETQKGAIEIEIFETGTIDAILVDVGSEVPVGTPLAKVRTAAEAAEPVETPPAPAPEELPAPAKSPTEKPKPTEPELPPAGAAPREAARRRVSPAARRLAEARGLDIATIEGSGPHGAVVYADVEGSTAKAAAPAPRIPAGLDLDAMRTAIAAAMARSKRDIPHYYLAHRVDMSACKSWLVRTNLDRPPDERLLMGALVIKAVALAARRFPALNGYYRDNAFEPSSVVNVGVAIAIRGGGLAAPALLDATDLALDALMTRLRDLVQRTRAGRIRSSELTEATITVSNLGERGVEELYGVIYPPQVAIVGAGKPVVRPWVIDGAIGPRPIMTVTLSGDHRASDGHNGALFLAEVGKLLQEPENL